jgi:hypothetical protein
MVVCLDKLFIDDRAAMARKKFDLCSTTLCTPTPSCGHVTISFNIKWFPTLILKWVSRVTAALVEELKHWCEIREIRLGLFANHHL